MSMTDGYCNHDRSVHTTVANVNYKIIRQLLKHLQLNNSYSSHAYRKGTGFFVAIDRAPATANDNLCVAYCSSGKITYLDSTQFHNQRQEYYTLLDEAFNGTNTANSQKAPHEILVDKINSAPKA